MPDTKSPHESNRAFYDRISEAYDLIADANERAARLVGIRELALKPGETVLEVGFGTGNEILDLAAAAGPEGKVHGIDISPGMLAVAQRKIAKARPAAAVELRVADARELPYGDESFDAVYSSFTLELFPPEEIELPLREIARILRPGGRFGNVSMAKVKPGQHASTLEEIYIWMHRNFPHIVDCRPIDAPARLAEAGFEIAKCIDLEIWTMPVSAILAVKPAGWTSSSSGKLRSESDAHLHIQPGTFHARGENVVCGLHGGGYPGFHGSTDAGYPGADHPVPE